LIEQARTLALNYVASLPGTDRVMVVYADALPSAVTGFETNRQVARQAIMAARTSASSLDLASTLRFAQQAMSSAVRPGEIVLAGGPRPNETGRPDAFPKNFRLLEVKGNVENVGIRRIGLRPAEDQANVWRILVTSSNQGSAVRAATLDLSFGGGPIASRTITIPAGGDVETAFTYNTNAGGVLEAHLTSSGRDDIAADNRASVEIAGLRQVELTVCSDQARLLAPVLESLPTVQPVYHSLAECKAVAPKGLAIYDGAVPASEVSAIVIAAPDAESAVSVASTVKAAKLAGWRPGHAVTAGLRSESELIDTQIYRPSPNDQVLGDSAAGPVAVIHNVGKAKQLYLGFHPIRSGLRYQVSAPLLFANALRWLEPDSFAHSETIASGVGMTVAKIDADASVKVLDEKGGELPFSRQGNEVRFFAPSVGRVRVEGNIGGRAQEQVFSMALPDVPDKQFEAPDNVLHGVPAPHQALSGGRDVWYWLVLLAGLIVLADWILFAPGVRRLPTGSPFQSLQNTLSSLTRRRAA
jgi:hypothetical protein